MRVKLQLVLCSGDGHEEPVTAVVTLHKDHQRLEHLGVTLAEAQQLLTTIQPRVFTQQVDAFIASHGTWEAWGPSCRSKALIHGHCARCWEPARFPVPEATVAAVSATKRPRFVRSPSSSPPPSPQHSCAWRRNGPPWSHMDQYAKGGTR